MLAEIRQNVRFNLAVNVLDGAFYGLGLGIASYVTVIPLFVATMTDSSVLIGLIATMHMIGWQLPQLLTANLVARLRRYKPLVVLMTLNERLPFFALGLVALALPTIGRELALILTFLLVTWLAMGSGLTGTAWQSMIAKIIPTDLRGTFYGLQSSAANLLSSGGALIAGAILSAGSDSRNFALCFFIAGLAMVLSLGFLNSTREPDSEAVRKTSQSRREFWGSLREILNRDHNLRLFIGARTLAQVASVGLAFFTVYAVRTFNMSAGTAGVMTGVMMLSQVVANPLFGWMGDRYSHRLMYGLGVLVAGMSAAVAMLAPSLEWFFVVFALAGIANAGLWTTTMALTVEFGSEAERPYYIGLSNTLVAPATLLAPILGGWLADWLGYGVTFGIAALSGLAALGIVLMIREPRTHHATLAPASPYIEP